MIKNGIVRNISFGYFLFQHGYAYNSRSHFCMYWYNDKEDKYFVPFFSIILFIEVRRRSAEKMNDFNISAIKNRQK